MKKTEAEIAQYVTECAAYITDKQQRDARAAGVGGFYDRQAFLEKLDTLRSKIESADKHARTIEEQLEKGVLDAFLDVQPRVRKAHRLLSEAWAQIRCAEDEFREHHPASTKSMDSQQAAVRLAHAYVGAWAPRRTASLARRIMEAAGIECSNDALKKWIQGARDEDEKRAKGIWPT